jgi:hypothetical protein
VEQTLYLALLLLQAVAQEIEQIVEDRLAQHLEVQAVEGVHWAVIQPMVEQVIRPLNLLPRVIMVETVRHLPQHNREQEVEAQAQLVQMFQAVILGVTEVQAQHHQSQARQLLMQVEEAGAQMVALEIPQHEDLEVREGAAMVAHQMMSPL